MVEVIGHERQRRLLAAKPAQSLLFTGPEGTGRRTVAKWFAYGLNCESGFPPCGVCDSCRLENHPDYLEIKPEKTTKSGQLARRPQIRLEQIAPRKNSGNQSLIEWIQTTPRFKAKVAVVDSAHLLGEQAANALLKLLEEPPSYAYIILIAPVREAVLPTLASRSLAIGFGPASAAELRRIANDEAVLEYSEGAVGRLLLAQADPAGLRESASAASSWLASLNEPAALLAASKRLQQLATGGFDPWVFVARQLESWPPQYRRAALNEIFRLREELSAYVSAELAYTRLALAMRRIYAEMRAGSPVSR